MNKKARATVSENHSQELCEQVGVVMKGKALTLVGLNVGESVLISM